MVGTSASATRPIRLMPPRITSPVRAVRNRPVIHVGAPNEACITAVMLLAWTILPMPKPAIPPKIAKAVPSQAHFVPSPFLMAYIGPPMCSPFSSTSRYCTASTTSQYLVAKPTRAVIHIQNRAPGPPSAIAVATPTMLPVPTVAASAVISAAKGLISPSLSGPARRPPHNNLKPVPILKIGMSLSRYCRNSPVPRIAMIMGTPQTMSLNNLSRLFRASMSVLVQGAKPRARRSELASRLSPDPAFPQVSHGRPAFDPEVHPDFCPSYASSCQAINSSRLSPFPRPLPARRTRERVRCAADSRSGAFADLGGDYLDRVDKHRTAKRLIRRLDALGYHVMLRPKAAG